MAKIILINPYPKYAKGIDEIIITPPLGCAYLAAVLKKNDHETQIIDANILQIDSNEIRSTFKFKPDLIGISVNIITYKAAIECARYLKSLYQNVPIIFGGPYCSSLRKKILDKIPEVDAIVTGEGEYTFLEMADSLGQKNIFANIKGIIYRDQNEIIDNGYRPLVNDIDNIPFPAYSLLPEPQKYKSRGRGWPVGHIITSRGCVSQCTFCNKDIFGNVWRPHSAERIIEEIYFLVKRYNVKQIDILDDNFTFDINRANKILDALILNKLKLHINLQNGIRLDRTNEDLLIKMKKAGVFKLGFGIETAAPAIQKKIKKKIDLEKAVKFTKIARSLGMVTYGFFILGLPGESAETVKQTVEFSLRMNPHFATFSICIPFPGTEIFKEVKNKNELIEDVENGIDFGFFGNQIFFKSNFNNCQEAVFCFQMAYRRFYLRILKMIDVLLTIRSIGEIKWLMRILKETTKLKNMR